MTQRVLIVDDSLTVRMNLEEAFRAAGFDTSLCGTLASAREAVARGGVSVVVLDVVLPDGDGVAFIAELKKSAGIPVVLLSADAEVRDRVRGLSTGADEYVGKPYDAGYVVSRVRKLVGRELGEGARVLIIDDSATFRESLRASLESAGYSVVTASTGEEGLRAAADFRPRALVVDGVLPGIAGADVVRRLRQDPLLGRTPCLMLTGSESAAGEVQALESGADAFVRKEEPMEVILARLAAVLRCSKPEPKTAVPSLLGPKRILAVDDSPTYLHALSGMLRKEGFEPILARSGEEAMELLSVQRVDCILLDLVMPSLSGNETCRRIKSAPAWREIPLMMLTAREERAAMIESIDAGADDYIPKSSEFDVLVARLRAQLRRKQFEDEGRRIREQLLQKELEAAGARAARELAETRATLLAELEAKNRELEAFTYPVSHDLRAPLRAIGGFSKILIEDHSASLDVEAKRLLAVVAVNANRMGDLIDDLLRLSRLGRAALQSAEVDMAALARSVFEELRGAAAGRTIEFTVAELPPAHGDVSLLRQVMLNLVDNALKYTRGRPVARVSLSGRRDGASCEYALTDNGAGFDPAYATKLFGVFQRLHSSEQFEGTGVGLALVRRIVERHGGRAWAIGRAGEGAEFRFTLPAGGLPS